MKKIFMISILLIIFISLSAVNAADNQTADMQINKVDTYLNSNEPMTTDEILTENGNVSQKEDFDPYIDIKDYYIKDFSNPDYIEPYIIIRDLPEDYDYNTTADIYFDGEKYGTYNPSNLMTFDPYILPEGKHTINIFLPETNKYVSKNLTSTFNASPSVGINIPQKVIFGDTDKDHITIGAYDSEANVYIYIDGKFVKKVKYKTDDANLIYSQRIGLEGIVPFGTHNITVIYNESKKGLNAKFSKTVDMSYEIKFYNTDFHYSHGDVEFYLPANTKSTPIATINNTPVKIKSYIEYGRRVNELHLNELKPGTHMLTVTYPGDDIYPKKTVNKLITVRNPSFHYDTTYGKAFIELALPEDAQGNLTVKIDGKIYANTPMKGLTRINLSDVTVGNHRLEAYYTGEDYNIDYEMNYTLFFYPQINYDNLLYVDKTPFINIKMNPNGNVWIYEIYHHYENQNSVLYKNGTFTMTQEEYNLTLPFIEYYSKHTWKVILYYQEGNDTPRYMDYILFYKHCYPIKITSSNVNMYYQDGSKLNIKIYDEFKLPMKSGELQVKIGTVTKRVKIKNGIASIPLTQLPGNYKIKILFYRYGRLDTSIEKKLTVKNILTLNTVKVKKSSKRLVLTAKLAKKLKGKPIIFKFNGKNYKATTNAKGIAKVIIPSKVLKKLKAGKKIVYQATYVQKTVKKTAKVLR